MQLPLDSLRLFSIYYDNSRRCVLQARSRETRSRFPPGVKSSPGRASGPCFSVESSILDVQSEKLVWETNHELA